MQERARALPLLGCTTTHMPDTRLLLRSRTVPKTPRLPPFTYERLLVVLNEKLGVGVLVGGGGGRGVLVGFGRGVLVGRGLGVLVGARGVRVAVGSIGVSVSVGVSVGVCVVVEVGRGVPVGSGVSVVVGVQVAAKTRVRVAVALARARAWFCVNCEYARNSAKQAQTKSVKAPTAIMTRRNRLLPGWASSTTTSGAAGWDNCMTYLRSKASHDSARL